MKLIMHNKLEKKKVYFISFYYYYAYQEVFEINVQFYIDYFFLINKFMVLFIFKY